MFQAESEVHEEGAIERSHMTACELFATVHVVQSSVSQHVNGHYLSDILLMVNRYHPERQPSLTVKGEFPQRVQVSVSKK